MVERCTGGCNRLARSEIAPLSEATRLHLHATISAALLLNKPVPRLGSMGVIEVADFRRGEWLAECRHSFFPFYSRQ
jgi:hypothetical protein